MPQPSINYYNDALDAMQAGNAPEALAAIVNSLTEDPNDSQTWQLYVIILNALGRTDDAKRATVKLKELGLSDMDELLVKAAGSASGGDLADAIPYYEAALEIDPNRPDIHASLALARLHCDDKDGALAAAEKAVALDPGDPHAQYALGHILRLAGKTDAALAALTEAVSIEPTLMIALYEQGMLLAETGKLEQALSNFEKFLSVHPGDPGATQAVATLRERMNGQR